MLPEPRALGPVSLLPAEQVRGVPGRADPTLGAPFIPTRCELCGQKPGLGQDCPKTPSPAPRFRISCQKIIAHKMFDHVVLVFIFLNCITIALERPDIDPGSTVRLSPRWGGVGRVPRPPPAPPIVLSPAGARFPQRFQLHLHSDLRGGDDGEGTLCPWGPGDLSVCPCGRGHMCRM